MSQHGGKLGSLPFFFLNAVQGTLFTVSDVLSTFYLNRKESVNYNIPDKVEAVSRGLLCCRYLDQSPQWRKDPVWRHT